MHNFIEEELQQDIGFHEDIESTPFGINSDDLH